MMNASRPSLSRGLLTTLVALLALAVSASAAQAVTGHVYSRSIAPTGNGAFTNVGGVYARAASSDLFVVDPSAAAVQHLSQAGDYLDTIDVSGQMSSPAFVARGPSATSVYVAGTDSSGASVIASYSDAGQYVSTVDLAPVPGGIGGIGGIAVDSTGRLFVGDSSANQVRVFSNTGTYSTTFNGSTAGANGQPAFTSMGPIAVDSAGNVYVDEPYSQLRKYSAAGAYQSTVAVSQPISVAVDPGNNDLFVVEVPAGLQKVGITRFSSAGARQQRFAEGRFGYGTPGLSIDGTSHQVFLANTSDFSKPLVDVYVPFTAPDVATTAATNIGATSARVAGQVNPRGQNTSAVFQFGTDDFYTLGPTPTKQLGSGSANVAVAETLTGLKPNTDYHYRLEATNSRGTNGSVDRTFKTLAAPPTVTNVADSNITDDSATLSATVNPNNPGNSTSVAHFEYGTAPGVYPSRSLDYPIGSGSDDLGISTNLRDLQPNTTYYYRVVADNGVGTGTQTAERSFTTADSPPSATAGASVVSGGSAQLSGSVDTRGQAARVSFQVVGTNRNYSAITPPVDLPAASGTRPVSAGVSGLPAGGTYEVRVRLEVGARTLVSEPTTFATPADPVPPAAPAPFQFSAFPYAPEPSNRFTVSASVKGSTGTVKAKVPGRGVVTASGNTYVGKATARPTKAGTVSLKVKLSKRGRAALRKAKSKRLRVKVAVRYRPTGGETRTGYRTLTFKR